MPSRSLGEVVRRLTLEQCRQFVLITATFVLLWMATVGLNPLDPKLIGQAATTGEGDALRQAAYLVAFALVIIAMPPLPLRRILVLPVSICLLLGWCWLSLSWAIDPDIGFRRLALTTLLIWMSFLLVSGLGFSVIVTVLRWFLAALLVLNFAAVALVPMAAIHYVPEPGDTAILGAWRGLLAHKNYAGAVCAFTILLFVFDARRVPLLIRVAVVVGAAAFLYFTQSKTSTALLLFAGGAGLVFRIYNPSYRLLLIPPLIVLAAVATIAIEGNWAYLMAPLDSNTAFTGRGQIWRATIGYALDHPLTGAGFGSFWNIGPYSPVYQYGRGWVTQIFVGHSGYFDLLATIGLPGLLLAIFAMMVWPMARLLASVSAPREAGALLIGFLVFCIGHNATETSLMDRDAIVQLFLVLTVALVVQICQLDRAAVSQSHRRRAHVATALAR